MTRVVKVNPQLAVELVYQELKRVEVYTKRIEDATARKVQIDGKSLESANLAWPKGSKLSGFSSYSPLNEYALNRFYF